MTGSGVASLDHHPVVKAAIKLQERLRNFKEGAQGESGKERISNVEKLLVGYLNHIRQNADARHAAFVDNADFAFEKKRKEKIEDPDSIADAAKSVAYSLIDLKDDMKLHSDKEGSVVAQRSIDALSNLLSDFAKDPRPDREVLYAIMLFVMGGSPSVDDSPTLRMTAGARKARFVPRVTAGRTDNGFSPAINPVEIWGDYPPPEGVAKVIAKHNG